MLEIITKAEITQHLEEGVMTGGIADVIQVIVLAAGPHTALGRGGSAVMAGIAAQEDILELVHAGIGEQQRGVVVGDQGAGGHHLVALSAEILEKRRADL